MADIRLLNNGTVGGNYIDWQGLLGAGKTMDWKQAALYEGRVFNATVGTLSTGIVGGGNGTVLDLDQPEFVISIPNGTTIIPISMSIQGNCADAIADHSTLQALICYSLLYTLASGTYTTETPICMKTVGGRSSVCTVASAATADTLSSSGADFVHDIDLARAEVKVDLPANGETPIILRLDYNPDPAPYLVGPGSITGYWGGTSAVTGYAQLYWAEFATSELF